MRLKLTSLCTALLCTLFALPAGATPPEPAAETVTAEPGAKLAPGQLPKLVLRWDCGKCEQNAKVLPLIEQDYAAAAAAAGYTISDAETADVAITEYRQRAPGMRVMFGFMAGKDVLTTRVTFRGTEVVAKDYTANALQGMNSLCEAVAKKVTAQLTAALTTN
jgi:hypothetical protein